MKKEITTETLEKLKKELDYLKKEKRKEIAERLREAISFGDLRENAAYDEAKEAQSFLEGRIIEIQNIIKTSKIYQPKNSNVVSVGSIIRVRLGEDEMVFNIVSAIESDPINNKISEESPIGKSFIGKSCGDFCEIELPSKERVVYKIIEIK
jgi:transcription elongation factor GreA